MTNSAGIAQLSHVPAPIFPNDRWMATAPCRESTANFHGRDRLDAVRAKKVCAECPFTAPCLEYALAAGPRDQFGVWGGLSADERRKLLRESGQA